MTVNLFAGSLIIEIICTGYSITSIPSLIIVTILGLVINFYEMFNACLQLFIFTLLTMDYDSGIEILNG